MPSTSSGTTRAPASSESRHRMECSGRTQRSVPAPQRMALGQGNWRMVRSSTSATISSAGRPGRSITANQTLPFLSSRCSSSSLRSPVARRKPASAFSGASTRGPRRSSRTVGLLPVRPSTESASRRGVEKAPAEA